ncbi:MAG TPA: hypothetical protein VE222_03610 [Nitrospiraceae bacterium]|nr:hypothetical protein [Nitrospiraceae bacterium]
MKRFTNRMAVSMLAATIVLLFSSATFSLAVLPINAGNQVNGNSGNLGNATVAHDQNVKALSDLLKAKALILDTIAQGDDAKIDAKAQWAQEMARRKACYQNRLAQGDRSHSAHNLCQD